MATDAKPTYPARGNQARPAPGPASRALAALHSDALAATALFVVCVALYWATRTHYNTFDAVSYANQIGRVYEATHDPHWLFHPHHLLFNVVNYGLWRAARALGYGGGPLIVMQRLNAVLGAAGIAIFYLSLRRLMHRSHGLPALLAAGLALSFGYWVCATDGRVNMPSLACLLLAFWLLCRTLEEGRVGRAAAAGALAGLGVLFHESAGLFVLVGLAAVMLADVSPLLLPIPARRLRTRMLLAYGGAWAATVGLPYLLVGALALHLRSPAEFRHWMTSYAELGWWWNFDIPHNLRLDLYAFRHAAFAEPPGKQGTFWLAHRIPLGHLLLYLGALAGWLIAVYAFFAALPLLWRSHHRRILIVCMIWILVYAAFFTVWSPGYFVFWVPILVPTGLLLALGMSHYRAGRSGRSVTCLVGCWIALTAAVNWTNSIRPHRLPDASPFQRVAADVKAHTVPGDVILLAGAGSLAQCEVDIPYFAGRDVISLHTLLTRARNDKAAALAAARAQAAQTWASGHAVYALDELWHGAQAWNALAKKHPGVGPSDLTGWAVRAPTPAWTDKHGRPVWRLAPTSQAIP
ncbi:MAG: glycosyltransferase family 39 protein [Armatimonadetes bacterium]|nr:glycosyltransferase family 39 protein [Armatimonadota bacterium]